MKNAVRLPRTIRRLMLHSCLVYTESPNLYLQHKNLKNGISLLLLTGVLLMISSCKDKHEALLGDLAGNWILTEVVAIESNPDNLALPSSGTVLFNPCTRQDEGQCQGKFSFDQEAEVSFTYSAYASTNQNINLLPDFETLVTFYLTGAWEVLRLEEDTLEMKGPLQITESDGTSRKLNVKISLAR